MVGDGEECSQTQKFRVENIARGLVYYYELLNKKFETELAKADISTGFHDTALADQAAGALPFTGKTLREVYHPTFLKVGGFKEDRRGIDPVPFAILTANRGRSSSPPRLDKLHTPPSPVFSSECLRHLRKSSSSPLLLLSSIAGSPEPTGPRT